MIIRNLLRVCDGFDKDDIKKAYIALKSDVYWDKSNTNLLLRKRIAEFESRSDFDSSDFFKDFISNCDVDFLINEISLLITPKKLKEEKSSEHINFIDNSLKDEKGYEVERLTIFIDCPVELHILNVLWIYHFGYVLDRKLSENCYGNRLNFRKNGKLNKTTLFKPYYGQYQLWRDKAIKGAKYIHAEQKKDVALLTMDIKDYYYSIAMSISKLKAGLLESDLKINVAELKGDECLIWDAFIEVHKRYTELLADLKYPAENNISVLNGNDDYFSIPIGLRSSPILANWYLKEFDDIVEKQKSNRDGGSC